MLTALIPGVRYCPALRVQRQSVPCGDLLQFCPHCFIPDLIQAADLFCFVIRCKAPLKVTPFVVGLPLLCLLRSFLVGVATFERQPFSRRLILRRAYHSAEGDIVPMVYRAQPVYCLSCLAGEHAAAGVVYHPAREPE